MAKPQLIDTKSILARLMATENLFIEQKKCNGPSFNVKTRVLTLPRLNEDVPAYTYDLYMGHEVGHALYTPLDGIKKSIKILEKKNIPLDIMQGIMNVVEDSRIERKIRYKYPGLRNSFVKAYDDLYDQNFFGTEGKVLDELNLVDRINLHQKIGAKLGINFDTVENDLLNDVENTKSYEDVIDVSIKIYEHIKKDAEEQVQQQKQPKSTKITITNKDNEGEDGEHLDLDQPIEGDVEIEFDIDPNIDPQTPNPDENSDDEVNVPSNSDDEGEQNDDSISDNIENSDENDESTLRDLIEEAIKEAATAFTDENYQSNQTNLFDLKGKDLAYVNIPDVDLNGIVDYNKFMAVVGNNFSSPVLYQTIKKEINSVVSYLVKEFELRKNAKQQNRSATSKTGDLDMTKIYSYKFNEDIFKKIATVPKGKSHGLVMFLDWSASMHDIMYHTFVQLLSLVMFCKKVNIPYEVYSFTDADDYGSKGVSSKFKNRGDLVIGNNKLVNILSSRMTSAEFNSTASALTFLVKNNQYPPGYTLRGTPLNETIIAAMKMVPIYKQQKNLEIVNTVFLSDGESNGNYYMHSNSNNPEALTNYGGIILRDPITKNEVKVESSSNPYNGIGFTKGLVEMLRLRTESHVVGFYMVNESVFKGVSPRWYTDAKERFKAIDEFKNNKCAALDNSGFDEYYFIDIKPTELVADNNTPEGTIQKYVQKVKSKNILTRFIKIVS